MRKAAVYGSILTAALLAFSGVFENEAMYGRIHADAQGYYGYLVAVFIEHTFDWETVIRSYSDTYFSGHAADFTVTTEWGRINKYYVGTAVLMLPFFLLSWLAAAVLGFPVDGYSAPFQYGMVIGALFYVGVGLNYLIRFMEHKGIEPKIAAFSAVLCLFATPLLHYSVSEPAMSHAYSFGLICVFLFLVDQWYRARGSRWFLLTAGVFGLIVLVRPVNGVVILSVPFITGGLGNMVQRMRSEHGLLKQFMAATVVLACILSIQSIVYLLQVGKPMVWSYKGEGFDFLHPQVRDFLFSYKKGLFVYTPITLLGMIGIFAMLSKRRTEALWLIGFLTIVVYVLSSWWNWYYGGSLGMRAMVEYLPFLLFGAAYLLQCSGPVVRTMLMVLGLGCVALNMIQSYQYQHFILHWDNMDKQRYWQIFLRTDRSYDGIFYREEPPARKIIQTAVFQCNMDSLGQWGDQGITSEMAFSGSHSTKVNRSSPYGSTLAVPFHRLGVEGNKTLKIDAMAWTDRPQPEASIAYSYRGADGDHGHQYLGFGHLLTQAGTWQAVHIEVPLILPQDTTDLWVIYPLNTTDADLYLDDIRYTIETWAE